MNALTRTLFCLLLLSLLTACDPQDALVNDCTNTTDTEAICRFHNPEDMELLPDGHTLLISQMGNMEGSLPGNLASFDTTNQAITLLFAPASDANTTASAPTENWGAHCPGIPGAEFSPHGISLRQRHDGRWQLAVINHGQRESVEMFEVVPGAGQWQLAWRGCVVPTDGIYMNDVALMEDGGFVASHMFDKHSPLVFGLPTGMWLSQLRFNTGYVFEWLPAAPKKFRVLEESRGPFINGILVSRDGNTVFASVYAQNEIRKLDRPSGKKIGSVGIAQVDNMAWDPQGKILAVSHSGKKLDQLACTKNPGHTCGFGYTVLRLDPLTMTAENILIHEGGAPMGAATVALPVGENLYLGSFSGDRIIRKIYKE